MTALQIFALLRRRWVLALAGAALSCWFAVQSATLTPLYSAELSVPLRADSIGSDLRRPEPGLVVLANLAAERVSQDRSARTSSDTVSLVGEGIRRGYSVTVPDSGGQWVRMRDRSELRIQAVGGSEADVRVLLDTALQRVRRELVGLQAPFDVRSTQVVRAEPGPLDPVVLVRTGSRPRAGLAAALLGGVGTVLAVVAVDRRRPRRDQQVTPLRRPWTGAARGSARRHHPAPAH